MNLLTVKNKKVSMRAVILDCMGVGGRARRISDHMQRIALSSQADFKSRVDIKFVRFAAIQQIQLQTLAG